MSITSKLLIRFLVCVAVVVTTTVPAFAQRRRGTELDLLRNGRVLEEIGVSDDVIQQIETLRSNNSTGASAFDAFREKLKEAGSEEERAEVRRQIREQVTQAAQKYQSEAIKLLTAEQQGALRRVFIENYGLSALSDDRVASDLKLSEDQRAALKPLLEERRQADRGGELSNDERDALEKRIIAVLTAEQLKAWNNQGVQPSVTQNEPDSQPTSANKSESDGAVPIAPSKPNSTDADDSVASFGAATGRPRGTVQRYSFNFRRAPWERVLQMFADGAGLTLDMQRVPPGSLTHLDRNEYSATKALDIINGYLIRKGFCVVRKDGFLVVVNLDEQLDQSLIPEVSQEDLQQVGDGQLVGDNQLVTVRVDVEGLDTARTAQEIEALLGPWGSMIALTQSQLIMVSDIGANLRRIMGLLQNAARPDEMVFESYHLKNIDVEDAEPLLLTQFGMRQAATNVSAAVESQRWRDSRSRDSRGSASPATPSVDSLQVAADVRTNSLLVTGTPSQHTLVKTILVAIDVGEAPDGTALSRTGRRGKYLMVYDVSSSDAREVTKTLDAIMKGVVVNEDGRNGKIHIMATEREHEEVSQLIRQLDGAGGRQSVAVIPLVKMDPLMAAATLRSLFLAEGSEAPTIETDLYGRRLIIRGEPDQVIQIKAVLAELGEDGSGVRPPSRGGLRRRYSLQGRSPDEFLRILQDTWKESESNPIRIIVPERSGPVRERRTSDGPVEQPDGGSAEETSAQNSIVDSGYVPVRQPQVDDSADSTSSNAEVTITVLGDDLLLSSDDPEALDRMEDLLDSLQQTLPYRTKWSIFYLQSADATETADMLAQIFPSSSVASTAASTGGSILGSLANSFSGIGSSLADATGLGGLGENPQSLRIIPDVRSNSLFIAGPDALLQDVWAMLRVLDANDIPESLRDMEQRTLVVEHADVNNVASILRDVFKPLLEAPGGNNRQQENPLAAMFGGGGGSKQEPQIRMTLGVDAQTSSLIVSSSQAIFDDVEELVETLDKNAKDANRRIRVIQLKNADPAMIQRSLTGLFPRVSTSVTSSRTGGGAKESSEQDQSNAREKQEQQFREEAIRRFRERSRQRGNSNDGGGRGGQGRGGRGGRNRPNDGK